MKIIYTSKGEEIFVDDEDYLELNCYSWHLNNGKYAVRNSTKNNGKRTSIAMHRTIMNAKEGEFVDHINHVTFDNTKKNLRICTIQENSRNRNIARNNTSGVTGVYFRNDSNQWRAMIKVDGKMIGLGHYLNFEDAVKAREEAEIKYFGEFVNQEIVFSEEKLNESMSIKTMATPYYNRNITASSTSGVKGVYWQAKTQKWMSVVYISGRRIIQGIYDEFEDAVEAQNEARIRYFGESGNEKIADIDELIKEDLLKKLDPRHRKYSNNTSGTTGVYWIKHLEKWQAMIGINKKHVNLGFYVNIEDAIKARKDAEEELFKKLEQEGETA